MDADFPQPLSARDVHVDLPQLLAGVSRHGWDQIPLLI